MVLEISVLMAQFPSKEIARLSYEYRTLGLGLRQHRRAADDVGASYDSDEGRAICGAISAIMTGVSYATSAEMAGELGPFPGYKKNADHMLRVMRNHRAPAHGLNEGYEACRSRRCRSTTPTARTTSWWRTPLRPGTRPWRLAQSTATATRRSTVIAPTGTIGLVMDCDTTGIEPDFALVKFKKLAGGGYFKIINRAVPSALKTLGYTDAEIEAIIKPTRWATARWPMRRSSTTRALKAKGFTTKELQAVENGAGLGLRHQVRVQQVHAGRGLLHRRAQGAGREQAGRSEFDLLTFLGFSRKPTSRPPTFTSAVR
jgi:ribonucleoside-diphosphate reductase alpha chain